MLKITVERARERVSVKLEGKLAGPWVSELELAWVETARKASGRPIVIDLSETTFIDPSGKRFLESLCDEGAELQGFDCMTKAIVDDIKHRHANPPKTGSHSRVTKHVVSLVLLAVELFWSGGNVKGQEPPPLRLKLRDAVEIALKQNPDVQISNLDLAQRQQERVQARAALLPQASFEGFDKVQRFNLQAFIGKNLPGTPQHAGPFQVFQAGAVFSFPILDLTLWQRWQASHQEVKAEEAREQSVREQTVLLVVSQYLGSLRAAADVQAGQSRVKLAQALFDQAADLEKSGVGTRLDALRAQVQLRNEEQRLIEAKTELETSLDGLVRLLSLDPRQRIELADEMSFYETPAFSAEESLEQAYLRRPEMRGLRAEQKALEARKKAVAAERLPKLSVTGGWAYQGLSAPTVIPSYQYQATVDLPLFTSGRIRAEIEKAELEQRKLSQSLINLRNQVALEVKTGLTRLEAARHEVEVANQGKKLAEESLSQARDRFKAGVSNNIELVTAQDELARAHDNQIRALDRYNQARADLGRATGQIEALYGK